MIAYVTSLGEPTTDLCVWSLERNGFEVRLIKSKTSLWDKLKFIYNDIDRTFLRVDADVVVNRNCVVSKDRVASYHTKWWVQYLTFDWFKQDVTHGGVQLIQSEAIPHLRANVDKFKDSERPESQLFRLDEFHSPRRCVTRQVVMGVHGYGQTPEDIQRIKEAKVRRGQFDEYDFDLSERLSQL